ncbi:hypothetical protein [Streptomyces sp. NPDC086010]|uniref:hypothetical protein n=1 Tax=Streptomyces sp. NPDC086010 TaxID=3365745 RepID=UPI0037D84FA1
MSQRMSPEDESVTGHIRRSVMLPGGEGEPREAVPQEYLDAFAAEEWPVGLPEHSPSGLPVDAVDTVHIEPEGGAELPADEELVRVGLAEVERPGRHRQSGGRLRKPALVTAAAVGAVLAVIPFLSFGDGRDDGDRDGNAAMADNLVPPPDAPQAAEDTAEPAAYAESRETGAGEASGRPSQSAESSAPSESGRPTKPAGEERTTPDRSDTDDTAGTAKPPKATPTVPTQKPLPAGTVVDGTIVLRQGQKVSAGTASLSMESDGNLVIRDGSGVVRWAANTAGLGDRAVFREDGALVVLSSAGSAVWSSGTAGNVGAHLILQKTGRLMIMSASGSLLWGASY